MDVAVDKLYQALGGDKLTGKLGEVLTAKELKYVQLFGRKGILRNIYVPKDNGETSEIDFVYYAEGIFVLSKNYSGWIFAMKKSEMDNDVTEQRKTFFYNPINKIRHISNGCETILGRFHCFQ